MYILKLLTSFPMGRPHPNEVHKPTIFDTNVLNVKYSFKTTPRSTVFISGMPEPKTQIEYSVLLFIRA